MSYLIGRPTMNNIEWDLVQLKNDYSFILPFQFGGHNKSGCALSYKFLFMRTEPENFRLIIAIILAGKFKCAHVLKEDTSRGVITKKWYNRGYSLSDVLSFYKLKPNPNLTKPWCEWSEEELQAYISVINKFTRKVGKPDLYKSWLYNKKYNWIGTNKLGGDSNINDLAQSEEQEL